MNKKVLKRTAAVTAIAFLLGGLFILFYNDVSQSVKNRKIEKYTTDNSDMHIPVEYIEMIIDSSAELPDDAGLNLESAAVAVKENVRAMAESYDDCIGWIYVPGTEINYPIMQSGDNAYYLHRAYDGSYLYAGSIFMDYRCNADFTGFINILYGHNMKNNTMFADVLNFRDEEYFEDHRYGWLTAVDTVYLIEFFAVLQTEGTSQIYDADLDWQSLLPYIKDCSLIYEDADVKESSLIYLSTCTDEGAARTVLAGKINKFI